MEKAKVELLVNVKEIRSY